jgi:hypothetical protein
MVRGSVVRGFVKNPWSRPRDKLTVVFFVFYLFIYLFYFFNTLFDELRQPGHIICPAFCVLRSGHSRVNNLFFSTRPSEPFVGAKEDDDLISQVQAEERDRRLSGSNLGDCALRTRTPVHSPSFPFFVV